MLHFCSLQPHRPISPDLSKPGAVLAAVNNATRRARARWPAAIVDRSCARRLPFVRPGRRNGVFKPNQETPSDERQNNAEQGHTFQSAQTAGNENVIVSHRPFSNRISTVNWFVLLCCRAGVTVLSAVGVGRRNIWSEARALRCPQRAHVKRTQPKALPRSQPAPSPRRATRICVSVRADEPFRNSVTRSPTSRANGTAHLTAKCYAEPPTTSAPVLRVLCPVRIVWRSPAPNPSVRMRA